MFMDLLKDENLFRDFVSELSTELEKGINEFFKKGIEMNNDEAKQLKNVVTFVKSIGVQNNMTKDAVERVLSIFKEEYESRKSNKIDVNVTFEADTNQQCVRITFVDENGKLDKQFAVPFNFKDSTNQPNKNIFNFKTNGNPTKNCTIKCDKYSRELIKRMFPNENDKMLDLIYMVANSSYDPKLYDYINIYGRRVTCGKNWKNGCEGR